MPQPAAPVRKLLSCMISVALALALMPTTASAASSAVCKIGNTSYTSVSKAFDAASSGAVITLLEDASSGYINVEKNVTLDLNGHTLKRSGSTAFYPFSFYVQDNISFTMKDSGSGGALSCKSGVQLEDAKSSFTLEGGTISASSVGIKGIDSGGYRITMTGGAVDAGTNGVWLEQDNGTFTMTGGSIKAHENGVWLDGKKCIFTMKGGSIATTASGS